MIRVLGIGCRAEAGEAALREVVERALSTAPGPLNRLAVLPKRAGTEPVLMLATDLGLPLFAIDQAALAGCRTATRSARIKARFGTGSVAEALALTGAGARARLCCERQVSSDGMATAAIAEGDGS